MTDIAAVQSPAVASAKAALGFFARYGTIIGLIAMVAAFSLLSPRAFPTTGNFVNVLNQASLAMIIAAGLTLAVIVGELDLSIGFAGSLHGILVTGLIVSRHLSIPVAIAIVLFAGALIGWINGLIVTKVRVNSVIATLGVGTILTGLAFAYSAGVPIVAGVPEDFLRFPSDAGCSAFPTISSSWSSCSAPCGFSWSARRWVRRSRPSAAIQRRRALPASTSTGSRSGLCHLRHLRRPHRRPARLAAGKRHGERRRQLSADRLRRSFPGVGDFARWRVPYLRHTHRRADYRVRLQRPEHIRRADVLAIRPPRRHPDRRRRAFQPRPIDRRELGEANDDDPTEIALVRPCHRVRALQDQPLVDLHRRHADGVVDLPFSFILARHADKIVLVDTGFMREGGGEVIASNSAFRTGSLRFACWRRWMWRPSR